MPEDTIGPTPPTDAITEGAGAAAIEGVGAAASFAAVAGVIVAAVVAVKVVVGAVKDAIDNAINKFSEYSAGISQAEGLAEITQTMKDMERAQKIEPELVRYIKVQTDLQQKFEDIKVDLLNKILKTLTPILEVLNKIMPESPEFISLLIESAFSSPVLSLSNYLSSIALSQQRIADATITQTRDPTTIILDTVTGQTGFIPGGEGE